LVSDDKKIRFSIVITRKLAFIVVTRKLGFMVVRRNLMNMKFDGDET